MLRNCRPVNSQYDAVAAALATHVADVADDEQLELAADALVKHLLWIDVMDDVKAWAQSHPPSHVTKREMLNLFAIRILCNLTLHETFARTSHDHLVSCHSVKNDFICCKDA